MRPSTWCVGLLLGLHLPLVLLLLGQYPVLIRLAVLVLSEISRRREGMRLALTGSSWRSGHGYGRPAGDICSHPRGTAPGSDTVGRARPVRDLQAPRGDATGPHRVFVAVWPWVWSPGWRSLFASPRYPGNSTPGSGSVYAEGGA